MAAWGSVPAHCPAIACWASSLALPGASLLTIANAPLMSEFAMLEMMLFIASLLSFPSGSDST